MAAINFMNEMQSLGPNVQVTENQAIGYRTTGRQLLDLNFSVPAMRTMNPHTLYERFLSAFGEDPLLSLKWIFFARDAREGLGERRLFRESMLRMATYKPEQIRHLLQFIPEYGRWDDLVYMVESPLQDTVMGLIRRQLKVDMEGMAQGESISLMAKWLPSINASSKDTVRRGKLVAKLLGASERDYRKMLSGFRKYLSVIEVKMSAKRWDDIKYDEVPSRANLIYKDAFLRNDELRRRSFLAALETGETKINAGTLYPHDIVARYPISRWDGGRLDQALEELWKALPNTVDPASQTMVVVDGSGSMESGIGSTNVQALHVSHALGIYFAERLQGQFHDKYITFSATPRIVDISRCETLRDKLREARTHSEAQNTNIEAVFDLVLSIAVRNNARQEDVPANILMVSDMEFDSPMATGHGEMRPSQRLFKVIADRWAQAGYKLPRLIFWNVNSRTGTIPVTENEYGVALVSGFSVNIAKMVMSGQTDPFVALVEQLMSPRYEQITLAE